MMKDHFGDILTILSYYLECGQAVDQHRSSYDDYTM